MPCWPWPSWTRHRIDEAIEHFQKSLEIEPESAAEPLRSRRCLGLARADGRGHRSISKRPCSLDPDLAAAHSDLGVALDRKGKKDEALEHFRRAVAIDPGHVEGLRNLGKALLDRQQYAEGATCFRKAVAIEPGSAEIRFDLGLALKQQETRGRSTRPCGNLRQALPLAEGENGAALVEEDQGRDPPLPGLAVGRRAEEIIPLSYGCHNLYVLYPPPMFAAENPACCKMRVAK